jgi:hypothetical protein
MTAILLRCPSCGNEWAVTRVSATLVEPSYLLSGEECLTCGEVGEDMGEVDADDYGPDPYDVWRDREMDDACRRIDNYQREEA